MPAISSSFHNLGRYAAIAMGVSIPISTALDNVLFALILIAWLASGHLREKLASIRQNPAALAALALLGLLLLGMAWGPGSARDGWYYMNKYKELLLVAVLGAFVLRERDKHLALNAFLAAMALTFVVSSAIWLGLVPVDGHFGRDVGNPTAFKLHITHGVLMALASFIAADRALRAARSGWRIAYAVAAVLAASNVFMVQGRTGHLVCALLWLYLCAAHWRWRGVAAAAFAGVLGLAVAYMADAPLIGRSTFALAELRAWNAGRVNPESSTGVRMTYYKTTAAIIRDHPVIGVGTGGFITAYREKIRGTGLPEANNPHNQYLLTAA
ncbi:MAG TPA: O-antigen ligase family protein, partial [Burkholderiales bacterium]|nr:O-antigen ligase family protein [Burkholderiales bacterium]